MNLQLSSLKVALVYDRVNKFGGAERVLLNLHEMFPDAPLYTSVYDRKNAPWADVFPKIYTSFLQHVPFAKRYHELLGWLMPIAFESFDLSKYDLVISLTSEAAKGIITGTNTLHVCYMLTPTRYIWSGKEFYFSNPPKIFNIFPFFKIVSWPFLKYVKWWDSQASNRPDKIIAISTEVQKRIKKYYDRESDLIFPPVNIPKDYGKQRIGKYHLAHGRFEPYKRLDLIIDVFNELDLPLIVSGSGSEFMRNKKRANKNIKFIFKPTDGELSKLYSEAKSFLMPQDEDFGIVSVEAQSFGVPVIALRSGGALDTVVDHKTGIFFNYQTKKSLKQAIAKFDTMRFNNDYIRKNAEKFSEERFKRQLQRSLIRAFSSWRRGNTSLASI